MKVKDGELQISASVDGEITLPIFWDRPETRRIFRDHLIKHHLLDDEPNEGQIQTVSARAVSVETPPDYKPRVVFGPLENFEFSNFEGVLTAQAAPALAKKFVEDMKNGRVELQVVIAFEGYDFQQDVAVINFEDMAETRYFKNLTGAGHRGLISRHQMANVAYEAATSRDIALTTEFDDSDFKQLVSDLLTALQKQEEDLKDRWASLDEFFTREGWDPEDFRADLINRSKLDANSEYASKFREDVRSASNDKRKAGGGFGFDLFGKINFNLNANGEDEKYRDWARGVTREVLDKWSVGYEEVGNRVIPKSITAYRNDFSALRAKGTYRVGQRKKWRSQAVMTIPLHPGYNIMQVPAKMPFEVRQEEVAKRVEDLEGKLANLTNVVNEINSSEPMTTKVVWQSRELKPADLGKEWDGKDQTFTFDHPVTEAVACVSTVDWRNKPGAVGDVHFTVDKVRVNGNTVTVRADSLFEKGSHEGMTINVIARVKTK